MADLNWANQTIWTGDCLNVMRGMNSDSVDLIYLDPPFNSNQDYAAPIGSEAAGAAFKDTWTLDDVDRLWLLLLRDSNRVLYNVIEAARLVLGNRSAAYLSMMAQRLTEMRRVLKPTGSIYLHCDPTMSHYLKLVMDAVFGWRNLRNEIVWCYTGPGSPDMRQFNRKHDTLFWFSVGDIWTFNADAVRIKHHEKTEANFKEGLRGSGFIEGGYDLVDGKVPETWWAQAKGNGLAIAPRQKRQYVGYPTQKPIALLERIIKASSNEGDMVLDPFCGCATACVAAERHGRKWIGIDLSERAAELVQVRIRKEINLLHNFRPIHRTDQPHRTDLGKLPKPATHKDKLYGEQSGQCGGCMVMFHIRNLTIDHIVPVSKGGTDHKDNLWLLCGACNSAKGTKSQEEFLRDRVKRVESIAWLQLARKTGLSRV